MGIKDRYTGTSVNLEALTDSERESMQRFSEEQRSITIPARTKHQIVYSNLDKVGVAISNNGRKDFRIYEVGVVYTSYCSTSVGIRFLEH
jgi:hypothetical protein